MTAIAFVSTLAILFLGAVIFTASEEAEGVIVILLAMAFYTICVIFVVSEVNKIYYGVGGYKPATESSREEAITQQPTN